MTFEPGRKAFDVAAGTLPVAPLDMPKQRLEPAVPLRDFVARLIGYGRGVRGPGGGGLGRGGLGGLGHSGG